MEVKPYQNKAWLYEHYVKKRMNMKDMVELLQKRYDIKISVQGLYNWIKKYDLLKFRGKGRTLGKRAIQPNRPKSPQQLQMEQYRKRAREHKKNMRRT